MTHRMTAVAALLTAIALPVHAGDFTSLVYGTGPGADLKWGTADDTNSIAAGADGILGTIDDVAVAANGSTTKVSGANSPAADKLYLQTDDVTFGSNPNVPTSIDYSSTEWRRTTEGGTLPRGTVIDSGTLTLIDYHVTTGIALGDDLIGDSYDFVFRDTTDNTLVFGTRFVLGQSSSYDDDAELNFMYRYGFVEGDKVFQADVAWLYLTDFDLRLYNASRSDVRSLTGSATLDLNAVAFQADINLSEGNPFSGLYLVKTDATDYKWMSDAIGYFQAGEEGQPLLYEAIAGFAPTVAVVPEPETYALFLAGLGLIGAAARRRIRS